MDATRPRRTRDRARQTWYALWRSRRFARHMGFPPPAGPEAGPARPAGPPPAGGEARAVARRPVLVA